MPKGKRGEKGILGVRKDPNNQILFSFCVRDGDEYPSDDTDSDYQPSDDEQEERPRKSVRETRQRVKPNKNKRKRAIIASESEDSDSSNQTTVSAQSTNGVQQKSKKHKTGTPPLPSGTDQNIPSPFHPGAKDVFDKKHLANGDLWGKYLPPEILLQILTWATHSAGAIPLLIRAGRVCSLWHRVSLSPSLWQKVDLSYGWIKSKDATLEWLCKNRLSQLREINLSSWASLTDAGVKVLTESCPSLTAVNLSYCKKIQSESIRCLTQNCNELEKLDLTATSVDATSGNTLKPLISKQGPYLKHFSVSGNRLTGFMAVLNAISETCTELELLDVSNCLLSTDFLSLNIEKLQAGCPMLKVLRITNSKFRATQASARVQAESKGFPALQELSVAVGGQTYGVSLSNTDLGMDSTFLHRVLKHSLDLRLLDIRGCSHLKLESISGLPVTDLQYLYMSRCSATKGSGLGRLIHKWRHSLLELDLSWNTFPVESLTEFSEALEGGDMPLKMLDLTGTAVTEENVRCIVQNCRKLQTLALDSCRGLPRGMKQTYKGGKLRRLMQDLQKEKQKKTRIISSDESD